MKGSKQQVIRDGRSVGLPCRSEEKSVPVTEEVEGKLKVRVIIAFILGIKH